MENMNEEDDEENKLGHLDANAYQIAMINKMVPKGFKFDVHELVKKAQELHSKKTSCLANY
jgi:hypothetical protein